MRSFHKPHVKTPLTLAGRVIIGSGQNYAHATTAELPWHVQTSDLIGSLESILAQNEFSRYLNYGLMHHYWNGVQINWGSSCSLEGWWLANSCMVNYWGSSYFTRFVWPSWITSKWICGYIGAIFVTSYTGSGHFDNFQCSRCPKIHQHGSADLTHWGRVMHICKLTITGSDNGLSPGQHQAIIWTNAGILLIWTAIGFFS